jgi:hypothetical protein
MLPCCCRDAFLVDTVLSGRLDAGTVLSLHVTISSPLLPLLCYQQPHRKLLQKDLQAPSTRRGFSPFSAPLLLHCVCHDCDSRQEKSSESLERAEHPILAAAVSLRDRPRAFRRHGMLDTLLLYR